ncbi:MAG: GNAT family N-acetyltransferase [Desulfobacteraceae bacterium]|nr:MAG: GNAT family N-acetyltransferase [Desulfobacteraceae bacterium]
MGRKTRKDNQDRLTNKLYIDGRRFIALEKLIIRRLGKQDLTDISKILKALTEKRGTIDYQRAVEEEVKNRDRVSFVAELDSKVVGFLITYILYGGFGLEKSAWIGLFGVDPKYMGQGIGKRMAQEVFKEFKKMDIQNIYSSVKWDSTDLLSFFKSLGFDRSDFVNLEKTLD